MNMKPLYWCAWACQVSLSRAFTPPLRPYPSQWRLFAGDSSSDHASSDGIDNNTKKIPIHLLAGFLGSGKTTTLQHLLHNADVKLGLIVNDVAAVNIDAKLVRRQTEKGVIELQNGCACCSMSDELMDSLNDLICPSNSIGDQQEDNDDKKTKYEAIIVELSGVADPVAIRNLWKGAQRDELPVTRVADLESVITVVDASTFGTDFLTWDTTKDREWNEANCGNRKISELLAEQVETADTIILNKRDLSQTMEICESLVRNLNPNATLARTEFGKVPVSTILSSKAIGNAKTEEACEDPACTDTSHSHSHNHLIESCNEPGCTDDHSHSHNHEPASCNEPGCTEDHAHSHNHAAASCNEPGCAEDHSHDHSVSDLGIGNFCYRASTPFHADRLMKLLYQWPIPIKNGLDEMIIDQETATATTIDTSPFAGMLRSKGFCWIAPSVWELDSPLFDADQRHDTAMYWSHAGRHLDLQAAGPWWATQPDNAMRDFFGPVEYEIVKQRDFVTEEFGDRRQELVFIGVNLKEAEIRRALDDCLLADEEMKDYRTQLETLKQVVAERVAAGVM